MNSTAIDLGNAITAELEKIKREVSSMGITSLGADRVLFVLNKIDERTAVLLTRHKQSGTDVREELATLLESVRDLPKAVLSARNCDWLGTWTNETMPEAPSGSA